MVNMLAISILVVRTDIADQLVFTTNMSAQDCRGVGQPPSACCIALASEHKPRPTLLTVSHRQPAVSHSPANTAYDQTLFTAGHRQPAVPRSPVRRRRLRCAPDGTDRSRRVSPVDEGRAAIFFDRFETL